MNFNPRSPRGLRLLCPEILSEKEYISIHAAQEGCDGKIYVDITDPNISIHAAQEGCDDGAAM